MEKRETRSAQASGTKSGTAFRAKIEAREGDIDLLGTIRWKPFAEVAIGQCCHSQGAARVPFRAMKSHIIVLKPKTI
jgi:hypothetical protein